MLTKITLMILGSWMLLNSNILSGQTVFSGEGATCPEGINRQLDSLMNRQPVFGKTVLIYFNGQRIIADTVYANRYKIQRDDSCIVFRDKHKADFRVKATDVWGLVNDYGERRRIYNGHSLVLWRTEAPYVYKTENNLNVFYYFSETLCGEVYPLSNDQAETILHDKSAKDRLFSYMALHNIPGNGIDKKPAHEFLYATADFLLSSSVSFTRLILECIVMSVCR